MRRKRIVKKKWRIAGKGILRIYEIFLKKPPQVLLSNTLLSVFSKFSKVFFKILSNTYFFTFKTILSIFTTKNIFKKYYQTSS